MKQLLAKILISNDYYRNGNIWYSNVSFWFSEETVSLTWHVFIICQIVNISSQNLTLLFNAHRCTCLYVKVECVRIKLDLKTYILERKTTENIRKSRHTIPVSLLLVACKLFSSIIGFMGYWAIQRDAFSNHYTRGKYSGTFI